ncbi:MAG: cobyric acid synthase [Deltaproteobacteria bacterium]|nr:cobyric acid synthase [Deltaproteobacteria bacterium]
MTSGKSLAPCLAVLGTGSDVGKSIVVTALCRILSNRGIRVAPYKAQNMSNNSGVTPEGLEMGRAQIVQAEASRIPPHVDMNPILLKPTSDIGSQVVLLGEAVANQSAREYHQQKETLFSTACRALDRLRESFDLVILEGAGSCAEVNLMAHDIVNFRMAEYADAPVILVGDIHRGGIFAQLIGTLACLPPDCRDRIAGFIINRFRGDISLFQDGTRWIESQSGKTVFGTLPWVNDLGVEAEDSVVIENPGRPAFDKDYGPAIAIIRTPHISNFTDFDPLVRVSGISASFIEQPQELSRFKAVILPGSKNTCFDLKWLHRTGWSAILKAYVAKGGHVLGICGGYQMLGTRVHDPEGLEGHPGETNGLDLLPVETVLKAPKTTTLSAFEWQGIVGKGYEIHMGQTRLLEGNPLLTITERNGLSCNEADGARACDLSAMGTYVHGFFDTPGITRLWLDQIGLGHVPVSADQGPVERDQAYDRLAKHFESHVDVEAIFSTLKAATGWDK